MPVFGGFMKLRIKPALTYFGLLLGACGSAGVVAAPALALSQIEILNVVSVSCAQENVSDGREQTRCDHNGPNIKVFVLERGYGGQPNVTLDGQTLAGERTAVCNQAEGVVICKSGGTTVGYLYTFDLGASNGGQFIFRNRSLMSPHAALEAQLYIK